MKIAIVDTNYKAYLDALPLPVNGSYDTELQRHLSRAFGTFDAYSFYLTQEGWQCLDIVGNYSALQNRWAQERSFGDASDRAITLQQIEEFRPDVVLMQDLSFFDAATLSMLRKKYVLCGQCSCPFPREENVRQFQILMTSFPHYVPRFEALGVQAHYLPLCFDPRMLSEESPKKQFDISFVGGVGKRSHWKAGTEMLERVADAFKERFIWFGYGVENLEKGSPLIPCYGGPCWGRQQYSVYGRSKISLNRHGEIAEGFTNNLRNYEITGMGAMLMTERSHNLDELFPPTFLYDKVRAYSSVENLIDQLNFYLSDMMTHRRIEIAACGQQHTLQTHTYQHRMKVVSEVLTHALEKVAA